MGLKARLREMAFARPRGFPVLGWGGAAPWRTLRSRGPVELGHSPHQADLLVLAGEIPPAWGAELTALFETLPLPRGVLWLQPPWTCPPPDLPLSLTVPHGELNGLDGKALVRRLLDPDSLTHRLQLPDVPPHPWRGVGPHGQGGEGMMGGHPYGRPMAMAMEPDSRDGMALDDVPTWLGPFFPGLPSGLQLDLKLQGDRVHHCQGVENRFPHRPADSVVSPPALTALITPTPLRLLERTRLASHLGWLADFLELAGRADLGATLRRHRHETDPALLEPLLERVEGPDLKVLLQGVGVIREQQVREWQLSGPVARACGLAEDSRSDDPAYRKLDFRAVTGQGGDSWARLQVRVAECRQSLHLLAVAGDATTRAPEGPRGAYQHQDGGLLTPSRSLLAALQPLVPGMEWSHLLLFVASLDLDMGEAALT